MLQKSRTMSALSQSHSYLTSFIKNHGIFPFFAEKVVEFSRKVPYMTMDFDEPKCAGTLLHSGAVCLVPDRWRCVSGPPIHGGDKGDWPPPFFRKAIKIDGINEKFRMYIYFIIGINSNWKFAALLPCLPVYGRVSLVGIKTSHLRSWIMLRFF